MVVVSVPVAFIVYKTVKDKYIREVKSDLASTLVATTYHVETYLKMLKTSVLQESKSIVMNDLLMRKDKNSPAYEITLNRAMERLKLAADVNPAILGYMLLDIKGTVLASNVRKEIGSDKSSDAYFIEGLRGVYIKDIYYSKTLEEILVAVSAPFLDRNTGKLLGVLVARVKSDDLYSIVTHTLGNKNETGEIYIVNKEGIMITPSKFIPDAVLNQKINVGQIKTTVEHYEKGKHIVSDGTFSVYPDYRGVSVFGLKTTIPEMAWTAVIEIEKKEVLGVLDAIKLTVGSALIIIIALFWIIGIFIARMVAIPITKLREATGVISEGNLDFKVNIKTNDEIGHLSRSFNKMTLNLRKTTTSIDNLEKEIAERKKLETALMEEKDFIDSAINSLPGIFYLLNSDGHFLRWNRNFEIVSEYSAEEMKKIHTLVLFPEEEKELVREAIDKVLATGKSEVEATLVSKNGSRVPHYFTGHLLMSGKTPYLVGMGINISERKEMERILKYSEERQRTIYESSADAIMTLDPPSWLFTACNSATLGMFGIKDESEFTSKTPYDLSPEYQPDGNPSTDKALEMINIAMKNGSHSFEWTHKRINGEEFPAHVLLTKVNFRDKEFLQATVRDITELELKEKKLKKQAALLEYIAAHDHLTGIANRSTFIKYANLVFQTSKKYNERFSVLEIDVDNFKGINDQYGHDIGDLVLQSVVLAIKQRIRAGDLLARIGGDEFGLIFTEIRDVVGAGFLADIIVKLFSKPLDINGKLISISVSIGIACYNPLEAVDNFDTLLKQADIAMYKAKGKGRNCFDFFAP